MSGNLLTELVFLTKVVEAMNATVVFVQNVVMCSILYYCSTINQNIIRICCLWQELQMKHYSQASITAPSSKFLVLTKVGGALDKLSLCKSEVGLFLNRRKSHLPCMQKFHSWCSNPSLNNFFSGLPETEAIDNDNTHNPFIARFKNWGNGVFNWPCHGERVRLVIDIHSRDVRYWNLGLGSVHV